MDERFVFPSISVVKERKADIEVQDSSKGAQSKSGVEVGKLPQQLVKEKVASMAGGMIYSAIQVFDSFKSLFHI
jgi:hypothetical protein